ncbi:MAG: mono/diheme cytochrome c family protein [Planctomycetaceae bacterium]|jgi:mono/diheme cytochrome c family protein
MNHVDRSSLRNAILLGVFALMTVRTAVAENPVGDVDYLTDIKPLLRDKCFSCHSARKQEGGLRLDAASLISRGGDGGPAIVASSPDASQILKRVTAEDDQRMPPSDSGTRLTPEEVAKLSAWIADGAASPTESIPAAPSEHWSFQPPVMIEIPDVSASWIRNDIDRFIAAEHQRAGVNAVGEASPSMLLRRVSLDLTGLPPTLSERQLFLQDDSADAFEHAVDRLLASPRYGERWARHFMDIWRYSDPSGYGKEIRDGREHIWRWRDWIVESLNDDKGYDRMIVEMLAADEVAPNDTNSLRATGFLARNWYKFNRNVWLDNIVEHSSKAFLGLTVNCARCHDHKYDPFEQVGYYRMRAIFETHDVRDDPFSNSSGQLVRTYDMHLDRETFTFLQGDENRPDKDNPLTAGLPELLGELPIEPVPLPVTAWYPALREDSRVAAHAAAVAQVSSSEAALKTAQATVLASARKLAAFREVDSGSSAKESSPTRSVTTVGEAAAPVFADKFSKLNSDQWKVESGEWTVNDGRLVQSLGETKQHRLISMINHPRDFVATLRLRITGGDQYRSVGLGFDVDGRAMNAVYLSVSGPKVQFTNQGSDGRWQYPAAGMSAHHVQVGQDYELKLAVKDQLLNVFIDGELKVAFNLPTTRRPGRFSIWTFSATAEFSQFSLSSLPAGSLLMAGVKGSATPAKPLTRRDLELALQVAKAAEAAAITHQRVAESELESLTARRAAELVKHGLSEGNLNELAVVAGRTSRRLTVDKFEEQIAQSRLKIQQGVQLPPTDANAKKALEVVEKQLAAQLKQLEAARGRLENGSVDYPSLGPNYPQTSSGRRLGFARWITDRKNPFAARVLVNHVWLRHFDSPLVERTFDFGLRSERPRHAVLLDWLAVRLMEENWSLKTLHKQIVMSGLYRLSSSSVEASADTLAVDPDNHSLWRMNVRRMEAEVVRDSVLHLGGSLDMTMGGPPVEHNQGQTVLRRSLYFRQDKERQMTFLSLFDGAKVNECYERKPTVSPQQALAMFNSPIASKQAQKLTEAHASLKSGDFVGTLFRHVLCREPSKHEVTECNQFLVEFDDSTNARHQLALVVLNHNDFVTIR